MRRIFLILSLLALVIIGLLIFWYFGGSRKADEQVFCTQEAKMCPDGSYVGRIPPKCEFAACPTAGTSTSVTWPTAASMELHYVGLQDWPPQLQKLDQAYSCTEAGLETGRAGITEEIHVSGNVYCRTKVSEGAAGSTYTQYAYAFPRGSQTWIYTFTARYPQCLNYDEPQRTSCQNEENSWSIDLDSLVDSIASQVR